MPFFVEETIQIEKKILRNVIFFFFFSNLYRDKFFFSFELKKNFEKKKGIVIINVLYLISIREIIKI